MTTPSARLWCTLDEINSLSGVLAVGQGPPPLQESIWLHFLALSGTSSGAWAMVNCSLLGPLDSVPDNSPDERRGEGGWQYADSNGATAAFQASCRPDRWITAAISIFASRLAEPIVGADPGHSGAVILRLVESDQEPALLEIAPATIEQGRLVSAMLPWDVALRDSTGTIRAAGFVHVEMTETEVQADLGAGPIIQLPSVLLRWPLELNRAAVGFDLPASLASLYKPWIGSNRAVFLSLGK